MTNDQWRVVCMHLENAWKGEMTEDRRAVYATFLKEMPFEQMMVALKALALRGSPWLPTVPELVAAIRQLTAPPVPSWTEAWAQIERLMANRGPAPDPLVVAFVEREGLPRLRQMPFYDPERGEMRIHQLRTRFEEFVDVEQAREQQRLVLGSARAAELGREAAATLPQITSGVGFPE